MLITKEVVIGTSAKNNNYYLSLGIIPEDKKMNIPIEILSKGSKAKVETSCDICGKLNVMEYRTYVKQIEFDNILYCLNCSSHKKKKNSLKKYKVESYTQTPEFKEKSKKTCLEKYGAEFFQNTNFFKDKLKQTCRKKYACENVMQNEKFFNKQQESGFKSEQFLDTGLNYQGTYELHFLEKFYEKIKIDKTMPIRYELNKKIHFYHPDFYLPEYNLIVEIKSKYTYEAELDKNLAKKDYSIKSGYNFIFIIDKNYEELIQMLDRKC